VSHVNSDFSLPAGLPQSGKLPVLNLLKAKNQVFFRPAWATHCTDSRQISYQIWHGRRAPGSAWLRNILLQLAQGWDCGPKNIKNVYFLVKSHIAGANPLTDF